MESMPGLLLLLLLLGLLHFLLPPALPYLSRTQHTHSTHTHLPGSGLGGLRILSARPPAPSRLLRPIITNLGEKAAASPPLSHTKALPLGDELGDSPRGHVSPLRDLPRGAVGTACVPPGQPSGGGSRARPSPPPQ